MKVTVSVFARYHAFYLAHELHKRGCLERLITTYPRFEVAKYGIPPARTISLLAQEVLHRGWGKLPARMKPNVDAESWFHARFDRAASRHLPASPDIYVGWSSFSECGLAVAKERGAVTIVERGSAHIDFQRDILRHENECSGGNSPLPSPAIVEKERREYALADYISTPSTFVRQTFLDRGLPAEKILVNPYGVDLAQFRQIPRRDKTFRVIFAGTLSLRKGVHYLLRAFAELGLPGAELWLVGARQAEIEPYFARYAGTFRYFGLVPQADLHWYYSQCSVFAICSIEEGMAMVQAQAMACGLPLLCTTNTGGGDLITEGREGFVVPIRDIDALKAKLLDLYENRELCVEMGQAAKRRVRQGFTWHDYGKRTVDTYARLLGHHG